MRILNKILIISTIIFAGSLICLAQEKTPPKNSAPIYADIFLKNKAGKSIAEFQFYVIHREKNEGDEFAEVFIKRIAVTNPKINGAEMKMIPKKIGIVYEGKISDSAKKYAVSFQHLGVEFIGTVEINPKKSKGLKQVNFYLK